MPTDPPEPTVGLLLADDQAGDFIRRFQEVTGVELGPAANVTVFPCACGCLFWPDRDGPLWWPDRVQPIAAGLGAPNCQRADCPCHHAPAHLPDPNPDPDDDGHVWTADGGVTSQPEGWPPCD